MQTSRHQQNSSCFKTVNICDLNIDPAAQRLLSKPWVKARVPEFDVERLGYIVVNKRADGKLYTIDGQHRAELMRAVGWGDQNIHAEVYEGLTQAQEADIFLARNDRKAVRKFDKFRIAITSGDSTAIAIQRLVATHGMVVSDQLRPGHIAAVDALERVYSGAGVGTAKEGPKALSRSLTVLIQAWGNQTSSVNGKIILALGFVFLRYNGEISETDLAKKLAPFPGGAPGLIGKGRAMQELRGRPLHHCIAAMFVDIYNKGRRIGKLEGWEA